MKFSLITLLPAFGLFSTSLANPVAVPKAVAARQNEAQVTILQDLYTSIQQYTGQINSTVAAIPADADEATKTAASSQVNAAVSEITALIQGATSQISTSAKRSEIQARQIDATTIAQLIGQILSELSGTLNNVIAALGLTSLLGFLSPLTASLSGLVASLELVVDNLLAVVKQLLDGILSGLSLALAGLVL